MRPGSAVWLALLLTNVVATPSNAGPTWDRGARSYVETTGAVPAAPAANRPEWPVMARLSQPTDRYDHDILGGIPRWSLLEVETLACGDCRPGRESHTIVLPDDLVFEDVAPRLWDVTGDGRPEVVLVEADIRRGARLAVWGFAEPQGDLTRLAATAFIGAPHRWLAPVGFGDLDGDGRTEIAYVDRPHLVHDLIFVRLDGDRLREIARAHGFTAHRIGDTTITSATRTCSPGQIEVLLPNADWSRLYGVQLRNGTTQARDLGTMSATALRAATETACD